MKIIEYKTATADSCAALDAAVNKMLAQGFQLFGDPYSSHNNAGGMAGTSQLAQAMVRYGLREGLEPQEVVPQTSLVP
jgi:hypothetical protein